MEVQAVSKSVRMSPRKVRLVVDAIRHLSIEEAFRVLKVSQKRAAGPVAKTLHSAVANAVNNAKLDQKELVIGTIMVNEGQALKRFRPSTRGRIHPYKKRSSNITIVVKSVSAPVAAKPAVVKQDEKVVKPAEKKAAVAKTEKKEEKK
jgi:large subunit ribosomal protein L22